MAPLSHDRLIALAGQAGLDVAAFRTALNQHSYAAAVSADMATWVMTRPDQLPCAAIVRALGAEDERAR
jgi:predicted DsbA family dithiol-disulfide isomerase